MGFNEVTAAAQAFSEGTQLFGESFSYTAPSGGSPVSGLIGVFNQVSQDFTLEDFSTKKVTSLICITSKAQWGAVVPADRGIITYASITYQIEKTDGTDTPAEPTYALTCKKLT